MWGGASVLLERCRPCQTQAQRVSPAATAGSAGTAEVQLCRSSAFTGCACRPRALAGGAWPTYTVMLTCHLESARALPTVRALIR